MRPLLLPLLILALPASADDEPAFGSIVREARALGSGRPQSPPAAGASTVGRVDLRAATGWPRGAPQQGELGNCHVFPAAALLNAAWFKRFGETKRFSPAHIFVKAVMETGRYNGYLVGKPMTLLEAGAVAEDLETVLRFGVARESDLPYAEFERRYFASILPANKADMIRDDSGNLTRLANLDQLANHGNAEARKTQQTLMVSLLDAQLARNRELLGRAFPDRWPAIEAEKLRNKRAFADAGFRAVPKVFAHSAETPGQRAVRVDWRCSEVRDYLVSNLDAGRPVAVSYEMNHGGSEAWGLGAVPSSSISQSDFHSFVIVGYEPDDDAFLRFATLNSWGPAGNYPLPETALCHVMDAVVIEDGSPAP